MSIADELTSRQKHDEAFVAHYRLAQAPRADYLQNYLDCRASVSRLLDTGPNRSSAARAVEGMLLLLILANVAAVTVCTGVDRSSDELYRYYHEFELVSTAIFVVEYLARFWVAAEDEQFYGFGALCGRLRWAVKPINVLDAIALIPFVVDLLTPDSESYAAATTIRLVRLLRLFSLLRLERGFQSLARIKSVVDKTGEELLITVFVASIILVISSSLVYFVESEHNEQFSNMGTAMWWGVATLTTVGYGDIAPITPIGRLLGAFTAFIGVGIFALPAGIIGSGLVEVMMDEKRSGVLSEVKGLVEKEIFMAEEAESRIGALRTTLRPNSPPPSPPSYDRIPLPCQQACGRGGVELLAPMISIRTTELALLDQIALAIRREQPQLALCLVEERARALRRPTAPPVEVEAPEN